MNERTQISTVICTDLRTDSTNTLNAFKWIQATNTSLKFTFSQFTKIPYGGSMHINNTLQHTQTLQKAGMMSDSRIVLSCEHEVASFPAAASLPGQSCTPARWTCVDHRLHYGNWHRRHRFDLMLYFLAIHPAYLLSWALALNSHTALLKSVTEKTPPSASSKSFLKSQANKWQKTRVIIERAEWYQCAVIATALW